MDLSDTDTQSDLFSGAISRVMFSDKPWLLMAEKCLSI
jgi:hypothetical protein